MKKFKFSLEKVLQLKQQMLKSLKNDLGNLQYQLSEKEKDIAELMYKYNQTNKQYLLKSSDYILPYEVKFYKDYLNSILNQVKRAEEEKELILKKIEQKKQEIINLNIEISTVEKLKEKKLIAYNYKLQKTEEVFIEEFVSSTNMRLDNQI